MQNTMGVVGGAKVFITSCTPQWASVDWHANENVFNCSNVLFFFVKEVVDTSQQIIQHCLKQWSATFLFNCLQQGWAISGPRAPCGPPQRFQWPAEAFKKKFQISNLLNCVRLYLDKVYLHKNNNETFSVYHYCFSYLFYTEIRRYGPRPNAAFLKWPPS